jgi:dihydrofolate reductase
MATVNAGMTTSLDGSSPNRSSNSDRMYTDLDDLRGTAYMNAVIEETGAVLMGRGSFEMANPDSFVGNYEFQVPIFVLTHHPPAVPPKLDERLTFTFVSEGVDSAIEQAKAAAGNKAVQVVRGAGLIQQVLRANLVDELGVDVMPVVLGDGIRLLDNLDPERVQLEKTGVQEVGPRTAFGSALQGSLGAGWRTDKRVTEPPQPGDRPGRALRWSDRR